MAFSRTDAGHDALAYPCKDSLLPCTADKLADIGADCNPCLGYELYAVLCDSRYRRCIDDLRINRHLYGFEHIPARKVYRCGHLEIKRDVGLVCRYERIDDLRDISLCEIMCLEFVCIELEPGLGTGNHRHHYCSRRHFPPAHQDELQKRDPHSGNQRLEPQRHREEPQENNQADYSYSDPYCNHYHIFNH